MGRAYYLITVEKGVEPAVLGPFQTEGQRDRVAQRVHRTQERDDSLFWADVDELGALTVGPYLAGFFWREEEADWNQG